MSLSYAQSLSLSSSLSHTDINTHTYSTHTSFCYWHAKSRRKHKGSFFFLFFNPGTKTAKCNNVGQECWHLKMSLTIRLLGCSWNEQKWQTERKQDPQHRQIDRQALLLLLTLLFSPVSGLLILLFSPFFFSHLPHSSPFLPQYFTHLYYPFMFLFC